ncbi:glycosyl transferase family 1 [Flavobacterium crocinum]|uniref:Glycosyl transferase family 1 n=1 Tax=Flavobacterium crocinum TaxID=2183896 RepID=A0A2S1YG14_9FLAO|nr:glycosyltransferase family 4 protein [Flavobacterium crocinum]AWK02989.1 glycosyl transferase family 1 [Flavobacterium crocinum]
MIILLISMPSIHVIRWIENLKDTHYEIYWFDVLGRGKLDTLTSVKQFTNWKKRKVKYIKGEYFLSKKKPNLYERIIPYLEITANEALENIIKEIKPDVIHSFEMQGCSYPIIKTMSRYPKIKWLYTCWGNDLFYYMNFKDHEKKIRKVLKRIDFLHTDCKRDFLLAQKLGFSGEYLGVVPGGTGYKWKELERYKIPIAKRKIILVKGYEHHFGRGLNIVKALHEIQDQISDYQIVIFGAHNKTMEYIAMHKLNFQVYHRHSFTHEELLQLMGKSLIYIGNSISDGLPNTLLEAIVMGAFPIQSNPGGATEEIINDGDNGVLINNPESVLEIKQKILNVLFDTGLQESAAEKNRKVTLERLDYSDNKLKVIAMYKTIFNKIS